jgi:hypothetical protein
MTNVDGGPYTILTVGEIEGETLEKVNAFVSRYSDGVPEGKKDRPITFNTQAQAEKWIKHNVDPQMIEGLDWIIIPTEEAAKMREDLEIDPETGKFI